MSKKKTTESQKSIEKEESVQSLVEEILQNVKGLSQDDSPAVAQETLQEEVLQEGLSNVAVSQNDTTNTAEELSQDEIGQIVDELAATPKRKRIWEIDFLRGLMILFVVWDHLMFDFRQFHPYQTDFFNSVYQFAVDYQKGALRALTHDVFVTLFVITSGISCSFSRSNGKRALKMVIFAVLFTAVTYGAEMLFSAKVTIYFNVIHVIALSVAFWAFIEWVWSKCNKNWQKNIFGVVMGAVIITVLIVGHLAKLDPWTNTNPAFYIFAKHKENPIKGADFLPFFPDFGWFLIGAFLGRFLYREKKSLFPSVNPKWVCPFTFCGRFSIWIYFGSQVVMYGLIYLLARVAGIL